ncbi:hypothetical protein FIV42_07485 [Persicimonas caeni]|uniref:Uncharacterized protein n=1 Tax=Persicimonas caeni TaxID=2292766 RepID=A0A4Y6PQF7_PERCE|nr:hypothetical protein [Persicimonas caeni]QDG50581.1 hypothetical protein FIV42_07485 [Persicimonas caeni]QED31802.1 hypothetical protein FRD00_07480 [Persicimonas caeni]
MSLHPEQTPSNEALAAARREGELAERRRGRRRLLVALVVSATLLAATIATGWALVVQAREAAPEVISQMAVERRAALDRRLDERTDEAAVLVGDLFGFLQQVWLENEAMSQIRSSVGSARAQLSLLDEEVRAALDSPVTHLEPLLDNGPTRARQLAAHLVVVTAEIRHLVPTVVDALGDAQQTFEESPDDSTIRAVIASMDALIEPFLGQHVQLRARWAGLQTELLAWVERVEADLADARRQMSGDTLGDEFLERLMRRLF